MKALIVLIALLVSNSAFAEVQVIKSKDNPGLAEQYIEAANDAIKAANKEKCIFGDVAEGELWSLKSWIEFAKVITVTDGVQPLLTFDSDVLHSNDFNRVAIRLTTTPDYKQVLRVEVQAFRSIRVNVGDLKNPKMTDGWALISKYSCAN